MSPPANVLLRSPVWPRRARERYRRTLSPNGRANTNCDEELHVFPTLLACDDAELRHTTEALGENHAWIELCWLDIEPQLALAAEGLSSYDLAALRAAMESFVTGMSEHMALDDSLLYAQLRGWLHAAARRTISSDIAARRGGGSRG